MNSFRSAAWVGLIATLPLFFSGCIRSRVTIHSDPPRAEVIFNGRHRGVTPITIPFRWYWYYDVVLQKEGFESFEAIERFRSPPWFLMPLDILAEIVPIPISDHRERHYVLQEIEADLQQPR